MGWQRCTLRVPSGGRSDSPQARDHTSRSPISRSGARNITWWGSHVNHSFGFTARALILTNHTHNQNISLTLMQVHSAGQIRTALVAASSKIVRICTN